MKGKYSEVNVSVNLKSRKKTFKWELRRHLKRQHPVETRLFRLVSLSQSPTFNLYLIVWLVVVVHQNNETLANVTPVTEVAQYILAQVLKPYLPQSVG